MAAGDAPQNLILYEGFPNNDLTRLAPNFEHQLLQYFNAYDEYSTLHSNSEDITNDVESWFKDFRRSSGQLQPSIQVIRYHSRTRMDHFTDMLNSISERMTQLRQFLDSLEPLILQRINMIGIYGINSLGRRLLFCTTTEAIRAVQVYRLLMPPNLPAEICIVLDRSNLNYLQLEPVAQGFEFDVDYI